MTMTPHPRRGRPVGKRKSSKPRKPGIWTRRKVVGVTRLRWTLRRLPKVFTEEISRVIEAGCQEIIRIARERVPVRTGDLREAMRYRMSKDGLGARVGYAKSLPGFKRLWRRAGSHAHFEEFGTKNQPATPFMRPAFRQALGPILKNIDDAVGRALEAARNAPVASDE